MDRITEIFKGIILPIISVIVAVAIGWNVVTNKITMNENNISDLKNRVYAAEQTENEILQRLASIDTKLEYIIKALDSLNKK